MVHTEDELAEVDTKIERIHSQLVAGCITGATDDAASLMDFLAWDGWWQAEPLENPLFDADQFLDHIPARPEAKRLLSSVGAAIIEFRVADTARNLLAQRCQEYLAIRGKPVRVDVFAPVVGLPIEVDRQARKVRRTDKPVIVATPSATEWPIFQCAADAYPNAISQPDLEANYVGEWTAKRSAVNSLNKRLKKLGVKVFRKLWQIQREVRQQIVDNIPAADIRGFLTAFLDGAPPQAIDKPVPLPEMVNLYPELRQPVVAGLLREAESANLVSMSKIGKSWSGYGLGLTVAAGGCWFERFQTRAGRVLLVDNELDKRTITFRVKKVAEALGITDTSGFHVHSLRGKLVDIYQLGPFFRQFKPGEYSLVILDALYRLWPARMSENDNAAVTAVINTIASYAERMKAAFVLVHHSSKGGQAGKNVVDVGSGAAALARAADTHIVLREHEADGAVVWEARTRSHEQPEPMVLKWEFPVWTPAPDLDPQALRTTASKAKGGKVSRLDTITAKVRQTLAFPSTKNALRTAAGANGSEISTIIERMIEAGEIEPCEVLTGGGKFPGYQRRTTKVGKVGKVGNSDLSEGGLESSPKRVIPFQPAHRESSVPTRHPELDAWNDQ